ncbi:type VII secretion target [Nocardia abscessus]|uniref:type VII secretion target n=1 Tax=Nocardia abscessus TaxID=120957 RepID=UPI0002EA61C7|nr:type VII secretion target [Nocardia abscessus]MCC3333403.1 ESX-1 secretion-associated protein [Nocardia abscessus]
MLDADIQHLRSLATTLDGISAEIDAIDVRTSADKIGEALPGCSLGQVCSQVGEFTEGAWLRAAQRIQQLSAIVKQSADTYQTTDEDFKKKLDTMDFRVRG